MPFEDKNLAIERLETQKMFSSKQISKLNSANFYSSLTSSSKVFQVRKFVGFACDNLVS